MRPGDFGYWNDDESDVAKAAFEKACLEFGIEATSYTAVESCLARMLRAASVVESLKNGATGSKENLFRYSVNEEGTEFRGTLVAPVASYTLVI